MNIVLGANYEAIVSETKKLTNKTADLKNKLVQIRNKLNEAYDGQIDYNTQIKALEKRLYTQQVRISNLSNTINGAFDELLRVDAQKIEIDNNLKIALEKEQIKSTDKLDISFNSILSVISTHQANQWKKIIPGSSIVIPGVSPILQKLKELIGNIARDKSTGNGENSGSSGTITDTVKDTADKIRKVAKDTIDSENYKVKQEKILSSAFSYYGKKYVSGGDGPEVFDCIGFVRESYDKAGVIDKTQDLKRSHVTNYWIDSSDGKINGAMYDVTGQDGSPQPGDTLAWYGNSGRTGQPNHVAIYTGPVKNPITVNGQVIDMTTKSVIGSKGQRTYYKIDNEGYITLCGKRVDCVNALNSKNGVCLINSSDMGYSSSPYVWRLK